MRTLGLVGLVTFIAAAQVPPPVLTGVVLERDARASTGEFSVRDANNQVFRFQFDARTSVVRNSGPEDIEWLDPGDKVEVESEPVPGSLLAHATRVQVLVPVPPAKILTAGRYRAVRPAAAPGELDHIFADLAAHSNLSFSGVVASLSDRRLVLHTRDGDRTILIRRDTQYLADGASADPRSLQANMRVFVRAGKDLYEQVEAYQVIWGTILMARDDIR